jgi:hypothetical protein
MEQQIEQLLEAIKEDYNRNTGTEEMKERFSEGLGFTEGKKYIKIVKHINTKYQSCVWGFVVNTDDDKKFKKGDILKAAGWNAPARNSARGNIFSSYHIRWTGPNYLR